METVVISLGGSVLAPSHIDVNFLKRFRKLIMGLKGKRFVIICGGGKTAREYMKAASGILKITPDDLDWIGIHATRLNAQLLRNVFRDVAHVAIVKNPTKRIRTGKRVIIAAGWKPGRSTDHIAVLLAKNFGANTVINITNTDHVYDKDPSKHRGAKPLKQVCWKHFRKLIGAAKWSPGLNAPFDPVAARTAAKNGLTVAIIGKSPANLERLLLNRPFKGTIIS